MGNGHSSDINNFQFRILLDHFDQVSTQHPSVAEIGVAEIGDSVVTKGDQVGRMPGHEVETFPLMCPELRTGTHFLFVTIVPAREILILRHLERFHVNEILADSIVEIHIDLAEPSQVEGTELSED